MSIEIVDPGPLTTIQDRGRAGWAHLGVPPSGAADRRAFNAANALVGNDPGAAVLESTLAGPHLRFHAPATVALVGADDHCEVRELVGDELKVGPYRRGVRLYVAVRGAIAAESTLGSRSTDLLTGLGPAPLRAGDILRIADLAAHDRRDATYALVDEPVLRVIPGPRADRFAPDALVGTAWRVDPRSNRVGIRLDGPPIAHVRDDELLSEPVVTGAIQVPRSGQPILLGPDHGTTGGYPVLGVVRSDDLWLAGQLRPGDTVRFTFLTEQGGAS